MRLLSRLSTLAALISGLAFAQAVKPSVMPNPLELKRAPQGLSADDVERLQREYTRLLKVSGAMVPEFTRYEAALNEVKREGCERDDRCLVALATKSGALYALFAAIDLTLEGSVVVSGRLVRDDGEVARATATASRPLGKRKFVDAAREVLAEFFTSLKVGALPAQRPAAVAALIPPPVVEPVIVRPVPTVTGPAVTASAPARGPGLPLLLTGGAVALVGGAVAVVGGLVGSSAKVTDGLAADAPAAEQLATGRLLTGAGFAALGVGAAVGVVGAVLLGASKTATSVMVAPVAGGAAVSIGGTF